MTDAEMKKVFDALPKDELNETELAISMLVALNMADKEEIRKAKTVPSER